MASNSSEKAVSLMGSVGSFAWLLIAPGAIVGIKGASSYPTSDTRTVKR